MVSIRAINRRRTVALYCTLVDKYGKFCDVSRTYKSDGKCTLDDEKAYDSFMNYIEPAVERFCGEWYTEGRNPDWFPHPIFIATHLIHGRNDAIKECIEKYTPNAKALVVKTYQLMHEHNMFRKEKKEDENAQ